MLDALKPLLDSDHYGCLSRKSFLNEEANGAGHLYKKK